MNKFIVGIGVLALCLTTNTAVSAAEDITPVTRSQSEIAAQLAEITAQLERIRDLLAATAVESQLGFRVKVDDTIMVDKPTLGMTRESAQAQCENVAYNTDHMWKLVTCTFGGETLYQDVFVAG